MSILQGRCACGTIGYEARVDYLDRRFCQCPLCRGLLDHRVVVGVLVVPRGGLSWHGQAPVLYEDGGRGVRAVCGVCGSTLATWSPGGSLVDLDASLLEDEGAIGTRSHVRPPPRVPLTGVAPASAG